MIIESLDLPPIGTNAYCLLNPDQHTACVIDAPKALTSKQYSLAKQHNCQIEALASQRTLGPHSGRVRLQIMRTLFTGHKADELLFNQPEKMANFALPSIELHPCNIDQWLIPGTEIELIGQKFEVRHVPGHCPGNVLLYCKAAKCAFVGDVIFDGSIGRYDLPGGDFGTLETSIKEQVYTLPKKDTILYTGHGGHTTVEKEATSNPFDWYGPGRCPG